MESITKEQKKQAIADLDYLFKPRSVAIIGASTKELSIGNRIIKNLIDFGYTGNIYPVNPSADNVCGITAYNTILDVPDEIDVAHIVIPNRYVLHAIEDCGKKGVKTVIINTAGFKETDSEGAELEKMVVANAKKYGIRIVGPNCQGIINTDPSIKAYCNFTFTKPEQGYISIIAQSGGVGEIINQRFSELGVGIRMYASNGNACDVSLTEVLQYWGNDAETRVIVLSVENLSDPIEFMRVAKEVAIKKPLLAMKAGRTEEGAKAASSHTGGLARQEIVTELLFEKTGILIFRDQEEMCQAAVAFASQPIPKGDRVGLITNTGGPAIIATDELVEAGMNIPSLSEEAKTKLKEKLFAAASIHNPVDVLATANAEHFRTAMDTLMDEDTIDSIYINFVTPFFVDTDSIAKEIVAVNALKKKPIVCNLMTDKRQWGNTISILKEGSVPCYSFPETAARALAALTKYGQNLTKEKGELKIFSDTDKVKAEKIINEVKANGKNNLSAAQVYELLNAYRIPVADWAIGNTMEEAVKAADKIGYPVVVKADAEHIEHKSDQGGVAINLKNTDELRAAINKMTAKIGTEGLRFFIQKFMPQGRELVVGAKKEAMGHLLMFGLGGIYVEILKDVTFKITPLTTTEAKKMLTTIKASSLLDGVRGQEGVNKESIAEIILRISQLVTDFPQIKEMDINPIIAYPNGAFAVDARMKI